MIWQIRKEGFHSYILICDGQPLSFTFRTRGGAQAAMEFLGAMLVQGRIQWIDNAGGRWPKFTQ